MFRKVPDMVLSISILSSLVWITHMSQKVKVHLYIMRMGRNGHTNNCLSLFFYQFDKFYFHFSVAVQISR